MDLKEKVQALCKDRGISIRKFEQDIGIASGSVRKWDTVMPSGDKLIAMARYFGVNPEYFVTDEELEYYADPEVSKMTQELKDRPELKILFDASRDLRKEDIEFVLKMIEKMK